MTASSPLTPRSAPGRRASAAATIDARPGGAPSRQSDKGIGKPGNRGSARLAVRQPVFRLLIGAAAAIAIWAALTALLEPPSYIFPGPLDVAHALVDGSASLARHTAVTATEIILGLAFGVAAGALTALAVAASPIARRWILPVVVVTQTLPVFAIAPLLVVWLGYGLASKVVMAALIIYFPVATAYAEAMARVDAHLIDLARLSGASRLAVLRLIRAPGGMPGFVAGLKVAATVAPIGAVVGEWVGASAGLGYVMLHANARLQTDTLFAALVLLAVLALLTRWTVDRLAARLLVWQPET